MVNFWSISVVNFWSISVVNFWSISGQFLVNFCGQYFTAQVGINIDFEFLVRHFCYPIIDIGLNKVGYFVYCLNPLYFVVGKSAYPQVCRAPRGRVD